MSQPLPINVEVISAVQEDSEALNRILRESGVAAHCNWQADASALAGRGDDTCDLLVLRDNPAETGDWLSTLHRQFPETPLIVLADALDEAQAGHSLELGACDVVTLNNEARLKATLIREIDHHRLRQRVAHDRTAAVMVQQQMASLMDRTTDAIAHVQEGILVETNKAWQQLFRYPEDDDGTATPIMDAFKADSQATVKGALVAVARNRWGDAPITVTAQDRNGDDLALTLTLQAATFDGEPAVRLAIQQEAPEDKRSASLMRDAVNKCQSTFLYHRQHFLKLMLNRLKQPLDSGQRLLAWIRIDRFKAVRDELGVIKSEEVIADFAELLRQKTEKHDISGRFEGTAFTVLMERGSEQDAVGWAKAFVAKTAEHTFHAGDHTVSLTCSIGLCPFGELANSAAQLIEKAEKNYRAARQSKALSQVRIEEASDEDTRIRRHDALWVKRLTAALKENRFRLLQQPIAALDSDGSSLFDLLMRLVDEQGETVPPSDFLPAARRTRMMQALDRWVIGAALALCRERRPGMVFIRLSDQSLTDRSFPAWLKAMIARSQEPAAVLCFQVTEETALKYLTAAETMATAVRDLGCSFALEHCGRSPKATRLLQSLPLDFVKIDGSLITALAGSQAAHEQTSALVNIARERDINTIAEKVEDANTMAALWQLGISYMQGHYVQEPEVVLQETA